jgi:hypothetical protein
MFGTCKKDSDSLDFKKKTLKSLNTSLENWSMYGEMHNAFMENICIVFDENLNFQNIDEALDYLTKMHYNFADQCSLNESDKSVIHEYLYEFKSFSFVPNLYDFIFEYNGGISYQIDQLYKWNEIDKFERDNLKELLTQIQANFSAEITNDDFVIFVNDMISNYSAYYSSNNEQGKLLGTVLAISSASIEFWDKHPDQIAAPNACYGVRVVVATDVAGALVGGTVTGVTSYARNGQVDWKGVGISAGIGAVTASTGAISKVSGVLITAAKWIVSKF